MGKKSQADIVITEIGGTTGDIESQPFLEAIRQVSHEVGRDNCLFIHVTLVPYIKSSGEHKTKPTQHSVKELQSFGIMPDIIVTRCDESLDDNIRRKIALFCNVKPDCVIENTTLPVLYQAPMMLERNGLADIVCRELSIEAKPADLSEWKAMLARIAARDKQVNIALIGKYVQLHDAYLSVAEALQHGGFELSAVVQIDWVDSEQLTPENVEQRLRKANGIIVPGGFGDRGIEGMIVAANYARTHSIPYFGICLGVQIAVIEYARNVLGWSDANSLEFDKETTHPVVAFMADQSEEMPKGGTMRLGAYPCCIAEGSLMEKVYGQKEISERHRHRLEFNNDFREALCEGGLAVSGTSPDGKLVEAVELPSHPYYIGVQYHPEFKSRPNRAHPLFRGFIEASLKQALSRINQRSEEE